VFGSLRKDRVINADENFSIIGNVEIFAVQ